MRNHEYVEESNPGGLFSFCLVFTKEYFFFLTSEEEACPCTFKTKAAFSGILKCEAPEK
jgi:hypothetical protein